MDGQRGSVFIVRLIVLMGEREAIARDPFVQDIGKTGSALLCLRLSDGRSRGVKHYWLAVCVIIYLATLMPMTAIDCQQNLPAASATAIHGW